MFIKVLKLLKSLKRYKYRVRHVTLPCFFFVVVVVFPPPPVSLLGYQGEKKKESHTRRKPGLHLTFDVL